METQPTPQDPTVGPERNTQEMLDKAAREAYDAAQARQDAIARSLGNNIVPGTTYVAPNGAVATDSEIRDFLERRNS